MRRLGVVYQISLYLGFYFSHSFVDLLNTLAVEGRREGGGAAHCLVNLIMHKILLLLCHCILLGPRCCRRGSGPWMGC